MHPTHQWLRVNHKAQNTFGVRILQASGIALFADALIDAAFNVSRRLARVVRLDSVGRVVQRHGFGDGAAHRGLVGRRASICRRFTHESVATRWAEMDATWRRFDTPRLW